MRREASPAAAHHAVPPNASFLLGNGSFPDPDTDDGGTNANGDDDGAVHCSDIRIWGSNVGSGSGGGSGSDHDADDDALYCPLLAFSLRTGLELGTFFLSVLGAAAAAAASAAFATASATRFSPAVAAEGSSGGRRSTTLSLLRAGGRRCSSNAGRGGSGSAASTGGRQRW